MLPDVSIKKVVNPDTVVNQYLKPSNTFEREVRFQILEKMKKQHSSTILV